MLGLEDYSSDESDPELALPPVTAPHQKSSLPLPPPSNVKHNSTPGPSKAKSKRPVFTVARPSHATSDDEDGERAAKKPKLDSRKGAGSSSLLAMLPAPSKTTVAPPRVLGSAVHSGGGTGVLMPFPLDAGSAGLGAPTDLDARGTEEREVKSTSLLPPSLAKGKGKAQALSTESKSTVPDVDFFSLGTTTSRLAPAPSKIKMGESSEPSVSASLSITSAPTVPVFEPPPPKPSDPYPGYYQLPSGQWAAYEPDFYRRHYESWYIPQSLDANIQKGFEGAEGDDTLEIDGQEQLDVARKEREAKKALTANAGGGPAAPKMNIKPPKIGSRARTRHQLSALLTEAYENREALEEKIAQGRRNRKEAGNKYGF